MKKIIILSTISFLTLGACTQERNKPITENKTAIGAGAGAAIGAVIGALSGEGSTDRRQKAMLGAGIGALAGGGIGLYMDKQEAKLRQDLKGSGVEVKRHGNNIHLNMPGSITFATDSSNINSSFYGSLNKVSSVLKQYNQTYVDVIGHTDNIGDAGYNYNLSKRRASSVASYITNQGVQAGRLIIKGQGESNPVASNNTDYGRSQNRRVEIKLSPIT